MIHCFDLCKSNDRFEEITINGRKCVRFKTMFFERTGDFITYYGLLNDDLTVKTIHFDSNN